MHYKQIRIHIPWKPILLFIAWWVILQTYALLVFNRFRLTEVDNAYKWTEQSTSFFPATWRGFADLHARWDSGFYVWIAMDGYNEQNAAFLPLYPLFIRFFTYARSAVGFGDLKVHSFVQSAFLVSNLSAFGAAICIYALARLDMPDNAAQNALGYFLIFPTAFFLTVNYSESLFILLAALSFYAARQRKWIVSSGLGTLATLTRATGLCLSVALFIEWWGQKNHRDKKGLCLVAIPLAFGIHEWFLNLKGYSFFATQAQVFSRLPVSPIGLLWNLEWKHLQTHPAARVNLALDVGISLFVLVFSVIMVSQWHTSYGIYGTLCILMPLMTGHTTSLSRYSLAAFPVSLMLARQRNRPGLTRMYTLAAVLLLALYTTLYVQGYWAG